MKVPAAYHYYKEEQGRLTHEKRQGSLAKLV